ncbi:MAG TPA: branched-chain amino acid ABC transporter permease [bacterium]|nr:branched-chain amino acid ABC transporter permease [bacterium]
MIQYIASIATEGAVFSIMALGLNVIWGWAGDFDIAFYGYVAIGVYMAMVTTIGRLPPPDQYIFGWHLPFLLALLVATVSAALLALLVGAVALRKLRATYYAITTLSAVLMLQIFIGNYTPLFNGYNGLYGMDQPFNGVLNLSPEVYPFFFLAFCVAVLLIVYFILERLSTSPFGRALRAIREEERAAAAFGRNIYALKLKAYVIGAAVGGLGGGLFAAYLGAFNPTAWSPIETLLLYAAIFVGGSGNTRGVILGVFLVSVLFQEITRFLPSVGGNASFAPAVRMILVGAMILVTMRYRIQGLLPEPRSKDAVAEKVAAKQYARRGSAAD